MLVIKVVYIGQVQYVCVVVIVNIGVIKVYGIVIIEIKFCIYVSGQCVIIILGIVFGQVCFDFGVVIVQMVKQIEVVSVGMGYCEGIDIIIEFDVYWCVGNGDGVIIDIEIQLIFQIEIIVEEIIVLQYDCIEICCVEIEMFIIIGEVEFLG